MRGFFMTKTNLQVNNFSSALDHAGHEEEVLQYWDEAKAFDRSISERPASKPYVFYDGPPFATGLPHYGHLLASTAKDVVPRYWTMKGYRVERTWGWDCHGVPIENMIEGELGLKGGKKGIEELGIDKFNSACRASILRYDTEWKITIRRLGRWVDMDQSYKTMDKNFMESVWWAFSQLYKKGLVYQGRRVILYCPRCSTPLSNFEIAMDNSYKDLEGPSTTYKYKLKGQAKTYFLAWSTTPWNKLATPALAVNPKLEYVKVEQGDEYYILAKDTLSILKSELKYKILQSYTGLELEQFEFELHYDYYPRKNGERAGVIVADDYVTATEGTGIVTLAVYGEDDYRIMLANNIQQIEHVDSEGMLKPEVTPWAGMFMLKANPLVNEDLEKRGLVYHNEMRLHSVPVCYRCSTRLYHCPVPAWFINIQKLKPQMIAQNEQVNWYPEFLKHGRFGKGLETAPDWNISRSRYWGTPMPIWIGEKGTIRVIGSINELREYSVNPLPDLTDIHREFIDDIEVWVDEHKTEKGHRIFDVFDCWIESGSMPFASLHYPFENKAQFESRYPAQYIVEYIAQTRAWFYTLHVMSVALFGKPAFENAVTTGTILASDGSKMSKSKKNYPDPQLLIDKYGVDSLRLYLMSSVVMKADNLNFSESDVDSIRKNVMNIWWNIFVFYKSYIPSTTTIELPSTINHPLDRWLLSKIEGLTQLVSASMDAYDVVTATRSLMNFIKEFSTWYLRLSRERLHNNPESQMVFNYALRRYTLLMAPFTPFMSERIYQNLPNDLDSIHLELWPISNQSSISSDLETQMEIVMKIVEKGHAARKEAGIRLRQPLASITIAAKLSDELQQVLAEELNVKSVLIGQEFALDTTLSPELEAEGTSRDLMRDIQGERKKLGLSPNDTVTVTLPSWPKEWAEEIKKKVNASSLSLGPKLQVTKI